MAMVVSSSISGEEKARRSSFRAEKRPWMLRDYLRDDMSSCSSSGFRSFPRRQCCVAVRNIIEKEVIRGGAGAGGRKPSHHSKRRRPPPPPAKCFGRNRTISSALQRASVAVINAVKLLPFRTPVADGGGGGGGGGEGNWLLPRSFSKKLFKRSFWKRKSSSSPSLAVAGGGGGERKTAAVVKEEEEECDEIERWISSGVAGVEKYQPLDLSNDTTATSNSNSDGKSDSWSDITFTSDCLTSSSENDAVDRREDSVEDEVCKGVGVTPACDDSGSPAVTKSVWCNEKDEKEQYSPISILDFPENDRGSSSPFTCRVTHLKGTKQRLMEKLERFESLTRLGLEPVNLESLISFTDREDRSPKFSVQSCSTTSYIISSEDEKEEEEEEDDDIDNGDVTNHEEEEEVEESQISEIERKTEHLLNKLKGIVQPKTAYNYMFEQDILLRDFFRENITEKDDIPLLKVAEDWLNGQYDKSILGWEVKDRRQAYIRDTEEKGRWPRDTKVEKEEVATELGAEVLSCLIEELLLECCSS